MNKDREYTNELNDNREHMSATKLERIAYRNIADEPIVIIVNALYEVI